MDFNKLMLHMVQHASMKDLIFFLQESAEAYRKNPNDQNEFNVCETAHLVLLKRVSKGTSVQQLSSDMDLVKNFLSSFKGVGRN